jgi:hypothetical protein
MKSAIAQCGDTILKTDKSLEGTQPDEEQKRVYQMLGIDWEATFPTKKTEIPA